MKNFASCVVLGCCQSLGILLSGTASAAQPMKLTPQDYIDIKALSARYAHTIEHCTNRGYDYAALYTPDGEFGRTDDWGIRPKQISKGPDELARAAGGGPNGCDPKWMGDGLTHIIVDTVIMPTPTGAHGKSILLILGLRGDPNRIERLGSYEDEYVKTPAGWRFKSRWHVFPVRAASHPVADPAAPPKQ